MVYFELRTHNEYNTILTVCAIRTVLGASTLIERTRLCLYFSKSLRIVTKVLRSDMARWRWRRWWSLTSVAAGSTAVGATTTFMATTIALDGRKGRVVVVEPDAAVGTSTTARAADVRRHFCSSSSLDESRAARIERCLGTSGQGVVLPSLEVAHGCG